MDESMLHEVMVDKVAVAFWMAMALIATKYNILVEEATTAVRGVGLMLGCKPDDLTAVMYAAKEIMLDPDFLVNHKATDDQILNALWPNWKKNQS